MSTWLWWSTGKDSAWALSVLRERGNDVTALVTTVTPTFGRVSIHGVRVAILDAQAREVGLPVHAVPLPYPCPNEAYVQAVRGLIERAGGEDVEAMAFGDLHLEDVRAYRVELLRNSGIQPVFPLWGTDTRRLARTMIDAGLAARVVCLDPERMPRDLAGAPFDMALLQALPPEVDPCGERGEFHTCVTAGPMFGSPLQLCSGESIERDGFVFTDLELC